MIAPKRYTSRFTNRFGEEWEFEYDPSNREGALRGSDVDWHEYRVAEGRALGLVLNDEEIRRFETENWGQQAGLLRAGRECLCSGEPVNPTASNSSLNRGPC